MSYLIFGKYLLKKIPFSGNSATYVHPRTCIRDNTEFSKMIKSVIWVGVAFHMPTCGNPHQIVNAKLYSGLLNKNETNVSSPS